MLVYLLLLPLVRSEAPPVSGFLDEYKLYRVEQYLRETSPKPTKQGPVLFPNDGPPPPRPPLIVTSRPLTESIARSELNTSAPEEQRIEPQTYQPYFSGSSEYERAYPLYKLEPLGSFNKNGLGRTIGIHSKPFPIPKIYSRFSTYSNPDQYQDLKPTNSYNTPSKQKVKYINYYSSNSVDDDNDYDQSEDSLNNYAFSYKVRDNKTGDDFSHSQHSLGSATSGEYRVRLPDGRTQIVSYTADENGYKADVRYDENEKKETTYTKNYKLDQNYDFQLNHDGVNHVEYNDHNKINNYYKSSDNNNVQNLYSTNVNSVPEQKYNRFDYKKYINTNQPRLGVPNNEYNFQSIYANTNQQNPLVKNNKYDYSGQSRVQNNPVGLVSTPTTIHAPDAVKPVKEDDNDALLDDYGYSDTNKEYNDDELDDIDYESKSYDYAPHRDKFISHVGEQTNNNFGVIPIKPTVATNPSKLIDPYVPRSVRPTYDELKPLFVSTQTAVAPTKSYSEYVPTKNLRPSYEELKPLFFSTKPPTVFPTITYNGAANVQHHVPSTTAAPNQRVIDNDDVVVIGNKPLYTNIKQSLKMFQEPVFYSTPKSLIPPVTPREFLASTIAGIRDRIVQATTPKPILSQNFLDRINKYLKFV